MVSHLFFTVRISANHSNSILVFFVGWLFHPLQTLVLANQYNTLGFIALYPNAIEQVFEVK